ncbi:hypothetical protein F0562_032354 [Nyssa sinensis]|uniref:Chromo domain-containing protein n=1 Tax=Nyssa sinensis TaxID=561372 RepID=A0A5J5ATI9_9ASTE|nr:hypothetical protein F0562_032354 [Nyssa sinensis]
MTVAIRRNLKIAPRYYGPFKVIPMVGQVAYELDLPLEAKIYPVVHISCFKKKLGEGIQACSNLPNITPDGFLEPKPERILQRRLKKKGNVAGVEVLVQWTGMEEADATWEDLTSRIRCLNHDDFVSVLELPRVDLITFGRVVGESEESLKEEE